jgi:allantoate deiminase
MAGRLTTHVLDTAQGRPGVGIAVELWRINAEEPVRISTAVTNSDGRTDSPMLFGDDFAPGQYELRFHVGPYFSGQGCAGGLFDIVPIRFNPTGTTTSPCWPPPGRTRRTVEADRPGSAARVMARCDCLAGFSEEPNRLTRTYGSPALRSAQDQVAGWMTAAGMAVRRDAIGNLIGRWDGPVPDAPALLLGSHLDSVPDAGRYDGPLGILVAIAAVEVVRSDVGRLPFAVEVIAFADEEGSRFHTTFLGSRAMAGSLTDDDLTRTDAGGITLREAIGAFGGDPNDLRSCMRPDRARAYVEVHIEQGPVLEQVGRPIGVVTGIAGQSRIAVTFTGQANHAGTVPMHARRDALAGASEFVLAVERLAREIPGLVATVGALSISPGASNVIPGLVTLSVDIRHPEDEIRDHAVDRAKATATAIAAGRRLDVAWESVMDAPAVSCDGRVVAALSAAADTLGVSTPRLTSGAGHDAIPMAAIAPVGMLFVRCAGGISHHPDERVAEGDVQVAIDTLVSFLNSEARSAER